MPLPLSNPSSDLFHRRREGTCSSQEQPSPVRFPRLPPHRRSPRDPDLSPLAPTLAHPFRHVHSLGLQIIQRPERLGVSVGAGEGKGEARDGRGEEASSRVALGGAGSLAVVPWRGDGLPYVRIFLLLPYPRTADLHSQIPPTRELGMPRHSKRARILRRLQCVLSLPLPSAFDFFSFLPASTGQGEDCTAIRGAQGVTCDLGRCLVFTCQVGYKLDAGRCHKIKSSKA